jgi:hypothetical protein
MRLQIYFLPNDPFAVCVCPGDNELHPRLVWFNMAVRAHYPDLITTGTGQGTH